MSKAHKLCAFICAAMTVITLSGCTSNDTKTSSESSDTTSLGGTTIAQPYDDTQQEIEAIKTARIGDTIAFNDYCIFVQEDGTKVYFAEGAYAFVHNTLVVETRRAVSVPNSSATIEEIIEADEDFTGKSGIAYYYYNKKGEPISVSGVTRVSAEVPNCLVEFVDWKDDEKTQGYYYSYAFTYGDAPVRIASVYLKKEDDTSDTSSDSSSVTSSEGSDSSESTSSDTESTSSEASSGTAE